MELPSRKQISGQWESLRHASSNAYDGNGLRVKKCAPNCSSPTSSTVYIFSGSKVIAEYDNGAGVNTPTREYVYSGGALLATIDATGMKYHHPDHLSPRVTTDSNGTKISEQGHFPFGETWYETGTTTKRKFTSYERDAESMNDYALARYHVNRLGRFSSPDPVAGSLADPQSLNRYAYVLNDPINLDDPLGLVPPGICAIDGTCPFALWGGGPDWNCGIEGIATSCSIVQNLLQSGLGSQCPNNDCRFTKTVGGTVYRLSQISVGFTRGILWCTPELSPDGSSCEHVIEQIVWQGWAWAPTSDTSPSEPAVDQLLPGWLNKLLPDFVKEGLRKTPYSLNVNVLIFSFSGAHIPQTRTVCGGLGFGYGFTVVPTIPISITLGPLPMGNLNNAKSILGGWSVSGVGQLNPGMGIHATSNANGSLAGPSFGTPGAGVSATYSTCNN